MNILLLTAHSIAEYDDVRMLTDLGYDVFSIGAYTDPAHPADDKRPALPDVAAHPDLAALVPDQMAAKANLPVELLDWSDVIIAHHFVDQWIAEQWSRIRHKRVIWRTCGQSNPALERRMNPLRFEGLEIVRYSPCERDHFEARGSWAGQDALIRFGKYESDYGGWSGTDDIVANVTQNMAERGDFCGLSFWLAATAGLPAHPAGPGSVDLPGGVGPLSYDGLHQYLRRSRAYLYTGTVPASYTLGVIEALMTGIPTVTIGAQAWSGPSDLFECGGFAMAYNDPADAHSALRQLLRDEPHARAVGTAQRHNAQALFGVNHGGIGLQWRNLLGAP